MVTLPVVITIVLTFFSPYVNAYINKVTWSSQTKNLVAIAVSLIIAVLYLVLTGGIADWTQLSFVVPAVFGLQQAVYQFFLKNSASKFEAATTKSAVIIAPSSEGQVTISSDQTIKTGEDKTEVNPPVTIAPDPVVITSDTPAKG